MATKKTPKTARKKKVRILPPEIRDKAVYGKDSKGQTIADLSNGRITLIPGKNRPRQKGKFRLGFREHIIYQKGGKDAPIVRTLQRGGEIMVKDETTFDDMIEALMLMKKEWLGQQNG